MIWKEKRPEHSVEKLRSLYSTLLQVLLANASSNNSTNSTGASNSQVKAKVMNNVKNERQHEFENDVNHFNSMIGINTNNNKYNTIRDNTHNGNTNKN